MNKRRIGTTALEVTEVSFGGAAVGGLYRACSCEAAMETLQGAWDAGLRYFDTAPFYGFDLSERRFGDFLRGKPRGSYVLSTKVGRLFRPVPHNQVPDQAVFHSHSGNSADAPRSPFTRRLNIRHVIRRHHN